MDVIKGADGRELVGFCSRSATTKGDFCNKLTTFSVSAWLFSTSSLPFWRTASKVMIWFFALSLRVLAWICQYSTGVKARICRSFSTTKRVATDCTRPADKPRATFAHSRGDTIKPTTLSKNRRACWALTLSMLSLDGSLKASVMAVLVISLNTTRLYLSSLPPITSRKCHAIASPSLSKSVAR